MTDRYESGGPHERLPVDDATLAFDALRQTVEKLAKTLESEMTVIRKSVEAAFDHFDSLPRQPDIGEDLERISDDMVLLAEHVKALESLPALRYGPDDYGRMFELVADRVIVNLSRTMPGGSRDINAVTGQLRELVDSARDRNQQDRWLFTAAVGGLLLGSLLTLTVACAWPRLFF
jgi:hypothetical protein